jgi:hypothetical protein
MTRIFITAILLVFCSTSTLVAQENKWELKKNKNSVRVWTKKAPGYTLKQYRAACLINANADSVYNFIIDFDKRTSWYSDNTICKVLHKSGNSEFIVYYAYGAPWPVDDRDIISKAMCNKEPDGSYLIQHSAIANYIPREKDYVRIEKATGLWKIRQVDENTTEVFMEGKSNAGGDVPEWLANMFVEDNPFKSLTNLKEHFEVQ